VERLCAGLEPLTHHDQCDHDCVPSLEIEICHRARPLPARKGGRGRLRRADCDHGPILPVWPAGLFHCARIEDNHRGSCGPSNGSVPANNNHTLAHRAHQWLRTRSQATFKDSFPGSSLSKKQNVSYATWTATHEKSRPVPRFLLKSSGGRRSKRQIEEERRLGLLSATAGPVSRV